MKQFKGGLYANLGNYKSSLPQTKILNNFFKQNPVGYKKGGEVKGIKGVNYSRIPVTGGFMANAQGFQSGGEAFGTGNPAVSAFYGDKNRVLAPQNYGQGQGGNLFIGTSGKFKDKIMSLDQIKEQAPFGTVGMGYIDKTDKFLPGFGFKVAEESDFFNPGSGRGTEQGGISELDRRRTDLQKKEEDDKKIETIQNLPVDPIDEESKGPIGISMPELQKFKKKHKDSLGFTDPDKVIEDTKKEETNIKKTSVKKQDTETTDFKGTSTFDKIQETKNTLQSPEDILAKIYNEGELKNVLAGVKEANEADIAAINKIGKELYQKDGKDAPAWAMPLMMAGLQMAASNNPDVLGALGEGGVAGLQEYARIQKEKRDEAKEKVALDMQKLDKTLAIRQRGLDLEKDIALIKNDALTKSFQMSIEQEADFNKSLRDAIIRDADRELTEFEIKERMNIQRMKMDQDYDFKNADLEVQYQELLLRSESEQNTQDYREAMLKLEVVKSNNDWQKHLNLVNLEKVSTGKTTTIMMPDADGNVKAHKVQVYLNKETGEFETKVLGFAPPDADYLESISDDIREQIVNSEKYMDSTPEEIEAAISAEIQKQLNDKYGDIDSALEE